MFWGIRQSGIQQEVLERVRASTAVVERLGEPIETGWMVQGSISVSPGSGEADYSVPLNGPEGAGRVFVVAERRGGEWVFFELYVEIEGSGERIDLLTADGGAGSLAPDPSPTEEKVVLSPPGGSWGARSGAASPCFLRHGG